MADVAEQAAAVQDSMDSVSEAVSILFRELGIARVVSVDDSWVHNAEGALAVSARLFDDQDLLVEIVRLLEEHDADLTSIDTESPQAVADYLTGQWASLSPGFREQSLDVARQAAVDGEAVAIGNGAYEPGGMVRLGELLEPVVDLEKVGHTGWRGLFSDVAKADVGVLVLFDKDFSDESGGSATTGEELAGALLKVGNPLVKVAMLTRSAEDEQQELDQTRALEMALHTGAGTVVVIGKYRLGDTSVLPGALRVLLLAEEIESYRNLADKALDAAVESAREELKKLQRYTIMGAIASAQKEGVFELDPPLRLVRRAYERSLAITVRDRQFSLDHLPKFRSGAIVSYLKAGAAGPQLGASQRADLFEDGAHVNALGLPIEIGDIFETEWLLGGAIENKKFILLSQPCDISMRKGGVRAPEIQTFTLHEFRRVGAENDVRDGEVRRLVAIGPFEDDLESWGINFGGQLSVPALAVDATVFGLDGTASINIDYVEERPMAYAWIERHGELLKRARQLITKLGNLPGSVIKMSGDHEELTRTVAAGLLGTSLSPKVGISGVIDPANSTVRFGLRRVSRMLPSAAAGLLATSAAYHARPAYEPPVSIATME